MPCQYDFTSERFSRCDGRSCRCTDLPPEPDTDGPGICEGCGSSISLECCVSTKPHDHLCDDCLAAMAQALADRCKACVTHPDGECAVCRRVRWEAAGFTVDQPSAEAAFANALAACRADRGLL